MTDPLKTYFPSSVLRNDVRRAQFFPVTSLPGKHNYKILQRIERDGSVTARVFLNVADPAKRELLICIHYLRHLSRHFLRQDVGVAIISRDKPWDFRLRLSTGSVFNLEITSIADSKQHFELNKREERLTTLSSQAAIPLFELERLDHLFPSPEIAEKVRECRAAGRSDNDLVSNPFFEQKERILLGVLFQPDVSLTEQIKSVIQKKSDKKHQGKEQTVLIVDNRTSAFDVPDYRTAAEELQPFLASTPFPEIWFYTGYCSDDDGNNAEFSFAPLKLPAEKHAVLEQLGRSAVDGRVVR